MIFKSIFVYTPFQPPNTSSAALRGLQLLNFSKAKFDNTFLMCNKSFLFSFPTNQDKLIKRLLKELLCGGELFFKVLLTNHSYYLFSSPPFFIALLGATAALIKKKPYLFDIRDLYPQIYASYGLVKQNSPLYRILLKWTSHIYNNSHAVTTVTKSLVKRVEDQSTKKTILIRNGYDDDVIQSHSKYKNFSCIYHGNLGQFQRIDLILELAKKLPDIDFYIAGDGPKKNLLNSPPKNIKYVGQIDREEVLDLLSKCHLGLSFLDDVEVGHESFPVKIYEYIGVGIPSIVTPIGEASRELSENKIGKGFKTNQVKQISEYIALLSSNESTIYYQLRSNVLDIKNLYSRKHSSALLETQIFK